MFLINLWISLRVTKFYKFNMVSIEVAVFIDSPKLRSADERQRFIGRKDMENDERKKNITFAEYFYVCCGCCFIFVTVASVAVFLQSIYHAHSV